MASQPIVLEIDKLRTASGTVLNLDSLLPSAITPTGSVLTWTSSGFANDNSFAEVTYVDSLHNAIIGGASSTHDSLAKIEQELANFDSQKLDVNGNAVTATEWENPTTVHLQGGCTGTFPISGNESDIYVPMIVDSSMHNHDANYYTKAQIDSDLSTLTNQVAVDLSNLRNDILGGASGAYDTLLEIQNELQSNDADISGILTTMSTKAPVPPVDTGATEVLAWRSGAWVNDTTFAQTSYVDGEITGVIGGASTTHDTLGKIEGVVSSIDSAYQAADSNLQTQINTNTSDISSLQTDVSANTLNTNTNTTNLNAEISDRQNADAAIIGGASSSADTLGKIEGLLSIKASEPPNGIAAGEFLRWDETNKVFTFATPSTSGSGTSIPTPSTTTDTSTSGSTEVLIWDNTAGDLKNIASPFVEKPAVSSAGEYLSWNGISLVNSTPTGGGSAPPTQTSVNTFLYHDGTNWQYGTPSVASGAGTTVTSGVVQAVNNTVSGGEALSGSGYSSKGYASITTQLVNSMVLFMTSGTPQVNGEAHMYVHWRYRDTTSSPWSAYQDTGKILMRIAESYTLSEPREGAIAIHGPMRPAGAEIEYRVYFHVVAGTIYYPDNSVVSQLTNMTLMEVAI